MTAHSRTSADVRCGGRTSPPSRSRPSPPTDPADRSAAYSTAARSARWRTRWDRRAAATAPRNNAAPNRAPPGQAVRARPVSGRCRARSWIRGEMRDHRIGSLAANHAPQLFTRRTPHSREAAERGQQGLATPETDPRHDVELRLEIPPAARLAVERDRKAVRLITNALQQPQR